ncbi:MAG: response regulator [Anaerolineae bacterium]|nr:response regulator [Anaerolineae bacterium]
MAPEAGKGSRIKILIVDDIPEARENLKKLLAFETDIEVVGTASTGREGLTLAKELMPNIILMDINMPDMDGITATRELRKMIPSAGVVMMSVQGEAEYIRRAMAAGAKDFLTKPPPADELYETIRRVFNDLPDASSVITYGGASDVAGGAQRTGRLSTLDSGKTTHVVVVYSPQGGVGKTTVATNMATELMKEGTKVLLIDGKMQFGDVGIFLNLKPATTILDLVNEAEDLDMDLVNSVLATHDSGLRVLLAPQRPEEAELVDPSRVRIMIEKLRGAFDFIIIDLGTALSGIALEVFDLADRIILVATPTLPSVIHTLTVIKLFDDLGYPEAKVQLVINKVTPDLERAKVTLAVAAIESRLKRKAIGVLPMDERKVLFAVNRGTSVVAKERNTSPAKEIIALADALKASLQPDVDAAAIPADTGKPGSSNLLSRFLTTKK